MFYSELNPVVILEPVTCGTSQTGVSGATRSVFTFLGRLKLTASMIVKSIIFVFINVSGIRTGSK